MFKKDYTHKDVIEMKGVDIDKESGYDVLTRDGKLYEHFDNYAEAFAFCLKKRGVMRYWGKVREEK